MNTLLSPGRLTRLLCLSTFALASLGITGCVSQSEKEFEEQHGFKRIDYYGTFENTNHVPQDAQDEH